MEPIFKIDEAGMITDTQGRETCGVVYTVQDFMDWVKRNQDGDFLSTEGLTDEQVEAAIGRALFTADLDIPDDIYESIRDHIESFVVAELKEARTKEAIRKAGEDTQ